MSSFVLSAEAPVFYPRNMVENGLYHNEILVTLDSSSRADHVNKAVKYYCTNFDSGDNRNTFNSLSLKQKFKSRERKLTSAPTLNRGVYEYYYKGELLVIEVCVYTDRPLASEGWTGFHEEIHIKLVKNEKTREENLQIVDQFINDASEFYANEWLDQEDEDNKVTIYVWDEYWETLEKSVSRKISTIYLDGKETEVLEKIKNFRCPETKALYSDFGIPYKYNIMFHGVPGTGKTSLIFSLASELKMNVAILTFSPQMDDSTLMRCFRRIPENCILIIEDIDTLFESRKKNDELKNNITFSGLLNTTDGLAYVDKQIIIMTTNYPLNLDNALKRPGRIDMTVEFNYSTKTQIKVMFERFLPKQTDNFDSFYKKVKHLKLTTAILQHFFFMNRLCDNIEDEITELETICNNNRYEPKSNLYS